MVSTITAMDMPCQTMPAMSSRGVTCHVTRLSCPHHAPIMPFQFRRHVMPAHPKSCHQMPVMPSNAMSCHHAIKCHVMPSNAMSCHVMPSNAMSCHQMPCHAIKCHVMPSNAMPCFAMSLQVTCMSNMPSLRTSGTPRQHFGDNPNCTR